MPNLKQTLSHLILGQKGGKNRVQIIELLNERPYNPNQLAEILNVNYRTVKHHLEVLEKAELISTSKTGKYGEVYFLTPDMEAYLPQFDEIKKKLEYSRKLFDFTTTPNFYQKVIEQVHDAVVMVDRKGQVYFFNDSAEKLYGQKRENVIGEVIDLFADGKTEEDLMTRLDAGKIIESKDVEILDTKGKKKFCNINMDSIKDESGKILGYSIFIRNNTKNKKNLKALDIADRSTYKLLEIIDEPVLFIDREYHITRANGSFIRSFDIQEAEIMDQELWSVGGGMFDTKELRGLLEKAFSKETLLPEETVEIKIPGTGVRSMTFNIASICHGSGICDSIILTLRQSKE